MTTFRHSIMHAALFAAWLPVAGSVFAADANSPANSGDDLNAASERIRETGRQMQKDIQDRLRQVRAQRAVLEARQAAERKQETERDKQQAEKDRAALASIKEAKQREALAAAQEKARKEATARAAETERMRQAELKEKEEQEATLLRAQQESLDAYKAGSKQQKLGTQAQFGVDI
jgi:hypothetical protein